MGCSPRPVSRRHSSTSFSRRGQPPRGGMNLPISAGPKRGLGAIAPSGAALYEGKDMNAFAAAGAGFLLAVLWFDLMFDVQTRNSAANPLPSDVLASISAYYRRVTTEAYPMNRLGALVMLLTLGAI